MLNKTVQENETKRAGVSRGVFAKKPAAVHNWLRNGQHE